jgi:hypothetical protein
VRTFITPRATLSAAWLRKKLAMEASEVAFFGPGGVVAAATAAGPPPCSAAAGCATAPAPPDLDTAVLAAHLCRDLYPKNVLGKGPYLYTDYQRAFARKWCGDGPLSAAAAAVAPAVAAVPSGGATAGALGVAFVDTLRLHAAVLTMADGRVLCVFRGTDGHLQRWLNRFILLSSVALPPGPGPAAAGPGAGASTGAGGGGAAVRVHAAWWSSLLQALPALRGHIDTALAAAAAVLDKGGSGKAGSSPAVALPAQGQRRPRLYLAGHSLGAAFAELLAALTWRELPVAGVFGFGGPKVGDAAWADHYSSLLGAVTLAFENAGDNIPSQPPSVPVMTPYAPLPRACRIGVCSRAQRSGSGGSSGSSGSSGGGGSGSAAWDDGSALGLITPGSSSSSSSLRSVGSDEAAGPGGFGGSSASSSSAGSGSGASACSVRGAVARRCRCGPRQRMAAARLDAWLDVGLTISAVDGLPMEVPSAWPGGAAPACGACGGAVTPPPRPRRARSRHDEHEYVAAVEAWAAVRRAAEAAAAAGTSSSGDTGGGGAVAGAAESAAAC